MLRVGLGLQKLIMQPLACRTLIDRADEKMSCVKLNYCLHTNIKIEYCLTDEDDLSEILELLREETAQCYNIGACLKLKSSLLDKIESETPDHSKGLRKVISNWLLKNYNVEKFGEPTWKKLVEAVASSNGGNNTDLAMKIAANHKGMHLIYCKCLCVLLMMMSVCHIHTLT